MKVCPVCEMEEEDDALSCSMCGSDFEAETEEIPIPETSSESKEEVTSDIADLGNDIAETSDGKDEEASDLSEEEKLLEETLNATVTESSSKKSESSFAKFIGQFSGIGNWFGNLSKKLDGIFLTKGEINYIAPLTIVVLSILLLSGVIGLAVSTVPGTDQESSDGYKPTTPTYRNTGPNASSEYIGRGVATPFSGDPFNCELWDGERYYLEAFIGENEKGFETPLTDTDGSGKVDDEERYGCPVDMKAISTISFIVLNILLLTTTFYIFNKVSNTAIIMPVLGFAIIETILFAFYGGLLNNVIFALPLTIGLVCTIGLIVSGSVLLIRTSLGSCLLYTSPSPRDGLLSLIPSCA